MPAEAVVPGLDPFAVRREGIMEIIEGNLLIVLRTHRGRRDQRQAKEDEGQKGNFHRGLLWMVRLKRWQSIQKKGSKPGRVSGRGRKNDWRSDVSECADLAPLWDWIAV